MNRRRFFLRSLPEASRKPAALRTAGCHGDPHLAWKKNHGFSGIFIPRPKATTLLLGLFLLAGCGDPNLEDLRQFVGEAKDSSMGKKLEPPPEVEPYRPFTYTAQGLKDPFVTSKFAQPQMPPEEELAALEQIDSGVYPDPNRAREELEKYSLGSLRMVGTFSRVEGDLWALIEAPDGLIYRVQEGNYLGSDHGQIINVTEQRVDLTEIIPDGEGRWRNRDAFLSIAEE